MTKFSGVSFDAFKDVKTQMVYSCRVVFEPGVFQGTGEETRVNIVLEVDDKIISAIQEMEAQLGKDMHSCIKGNTVKCKLHKDTVKVFDEIGKPAKAPTHWRGLKVNASLHAKGTWSTRSQKGLCIEVPHIQLLAEDEETACPF